MMCHCTLRLCFLVFYCALNILNVGPLLGVFLLKQNIHETFVHIDLYLRENAPSMALIVFLEQIMILIKLELKYSVEKCFAQLNDDVLTYILMPSDCLLYSIVR